MNPNLQIDNNHTNKSSSPKQRPNEIIESIPEQQPNNETYIDDDTKYLMTLHQQIIPSQNLVSLFESFFIINQKSFFLIA